MDWGFCSVHKKERKNVGLFSTASVIATDADESMKTVTKIYKYLTETFNVDSSGINSCSGNNASGQTGLKLG